MKRTYFVPATTTIYVAAESTLLSGSAVVTPAPEFGSTTLEGFGGYGGSSNSYTPR